MHEDHRVHIEPYEVQGIVVAGLINITPYFYNTANKVEILKIDLGFNLNKYELVFLNLEPNDYKMCLFSIFTRHNNDSLSVSCSTLFKNNYNIYKFYVIKNSLREFYVEVPKWGKFLLYPGIMSKRIKELWNPTITNVTESFDPSELILIWNNEEQLFLPEGL